MHHTTLFRWFFACSLAGCASTQHAPAATAEKVATPSAASSAAVSCARGMCTFDLTRLDAEAPGVVVSRCGSMVHDCGENAGKLTARGVAALRELRDALATTALEPRYGCPGCADGPIYRLIVPRTDGPASEHSYDPVVESEIPSALQAPHQTLHAVVQAVMQCEPTELVELVGDCAPPR